MRRRILTIALAVLVIAITVPLGAALTFDGPRFGRAMVPRAVSAAPDRAAHSRRWPEAGSLAVTGGLLLGLAAVVKRTT
jgi:hypothetical protein